MGPGREGVALRVWALGGMNLHCLAWGAVLRKKEADCGRGPRPAGHSLGGWKVLCPGMGGALLTFRGLPLTAKGAVQCRAPVQPLPASTPSHLDWSLCKLGR